MKAGCCFSRIDRNDLCTSPLSPTLTNSTLSTVSEGYAYDALGRLHTVTAPEGDYAYAYLGNGRLETSLLRPNGIRTLKTYDPIGQLIAAHNDPYGRSTTNLSTVMAAARTYGYDLNGNMTNNGGIRLCLGQRNVYDGLGRRREKVVYDSTGTVTNRYLYRGWLVMAITDGTTNRLETYTHGNDLSGSVDGAGGIGGILSVKTPDSTNYYLYDFNGNVTGLTDSEGQSAAHYEYSPFGEVLLHTGSASTRFQFSTKEYDSAIRLNYYGYRYYSPEMGRWLSRDPLGDEAFFILYSKNFLRRDVRRLRTQQMQPLYVLVRNVPIIEHDTLGLIGDDDDGDEPPTCYTKDDIPDWVNDQLPQDALDRLNKCCIGPCCPGILWGGGVRGACIKCTF